MNELIDKPLSMRLDETKKQLAEVVNNCGLDPVLIKMLIEGLYVEVTNVAKQSLENDVQAYEEQLAQVKNGQQI